MQFTFRTFFLAFTWLAMFVATLAQLLNLSQDFRYFLFVSSALFYTTPLVYSGIRYGSQAASWVSSGVNFSTAGVLVFTYAYYRLNKSSGDPAVVSDVMVAVWLVGIWSHYSRTSTQRHLVQLMIPGVLGSFQLTLAFATILPAYDLGLEQVCVAALAIFLISSASYVRLMLTITTCEAD